MGKVRFRRSRRESSPADARRRTRLPCRNRRRGSALLLAAVRPAAVEVDPLGARQVEPSPQGADGRVQGGGGIGLRLAGGVERGEDVYKHNAAATFRVDYEAVDKDQRQIGKVQELACGFAGGVGAFAAMGRIYNVILSEHESRRMVDGWRRANPWAPVYWGKLEHAYSAAMRNPGREFSAGRVTYLYDTQHLWYALPSGRVLCYPFARFDEEGNITYAKARSQEQSKS